MKKHQFRVIVVIVTVAVVAGAIALYSYFDSEVTSQPQPTAKSAKEVKSTRGGNRPVPVSVYIADYERIDEGVQALGTLLPYEEVEIASEIAGKIDRIEFEEGVRVAKGALLVKVNDEDLQSQLKRAVYQRNTAKEKLERNRILLEKDAVSREAFDQIETDYNMLEADIQLLNVRIAKTEIRAPFDGVIGFRYVSLGSYLQPTTRIARLVDCSRLRVEFSMSEKYVGLAKAGVSVSFTTEGNKGARKATVYAVDPKVDVNTRTVSLRAMYNNSDMTLLPGMAAVVTIGSKQGRAIHIPSEALVSKSDGKTVWVVEDGKASAVAVITGIRGERMVEVVSGIEHGDSVIITGLLQVKQGGALQIIN